MEILNRSNLIRSIIIFVIMIFLVNFLLNSLILDEKFYMKMLEKRKEDQYNGIVLKKYIDKTKHSTPMIELNDTIISLENSFWEKISVGDSIIKKSGDATIMVFKGNGQIINLDYIMYFNKIIDRKKT
jgi:hypothetical protein